MSAKQDVIAAIYAQVAAPQWAATNLDALADVLRDLSWLPEGPVQLRLPELAGLSEDERRLLLRVLAHAVTESVGSDHPVQIGAAEADI